MPPEHCHSIEHRVKNRTTSQKETKTKANKRGGDQQQYAKGHTEAKKKALTCSFDRPCQILDIELLDCIIGLLFFIV